MRKASKIQIRVETPLYEAAIKVSRDNGTTASKYLETCMWNKLEKWLDEKAFRKLQRACEACAADNGQRGGDTTKAAKKNKEKSKVKDEKPRLASKPKVASKPEKKQSSKPGIVKQKKAPGK